MANKFCFYTAVFGNYDQVFSCPKIEGYDFIIFSDIPIAVPSPWINIIVKIAPMDNVKKNRFIKMHPHIFLKDYEYSIYLDGNISPRESFKIIFDDVYDFDIVFFRHPERDNIRQEIIAAAHLSKISREEFYISLTQLKKSISAGFVDDLLLEANVIFRRHNNTAVINMMENWWDLFSSGVNRDQFTLPIVISKNKGVKLKIHKTLNIREDDEFFICRPHAKNNFSDWFLSAIRKAKFLIFPRHYWDKKANRIL